MCPSARAGLQGEELAVCTEAVGFTFSFTRGASHGHAGATSEGTCNWILNICRVPGPWRSVRRAQLALCKAFLGRRGALPTQSLLCPQPRRERVILATLCLVVRICA